MALDGELLANDIKNNFKPLEFLQGVYDGALRKPGEAIHELFSKEPDTGKKKNDAVSELTKTESASASAGEMIGQIVDLAVVAAVTHRTMKPMLGEAESTILGRSTKGFVTGALQGGLLTKSDNNGSNKNDDSLLAKRFENALTSGLTFATMSGADKALKNVNLIKSNAFISRGLNSAIAGGLGGGVSAYSNAFLTEHRSANANEVLSSAAHYAAFNIGLHALNEGSAKVWSMPKVKEQWYSAQWKLEERQVEAKRLTYVALNKLNMRHPLHRLGDAIFSSSETADVTTTRIALTEENNPVTNFHKDFKNYISDMRSLDEQHNSFARNDYDNRDKIRDAMTERQTQFTHSLLQTWYGSSEAPGLMHYSDRELATAQYPAENVAQLRSTLNLPLRRDSNYQPSPFEQGLAKLAPENIENEHRKFELSFGFGYGRERFFNYNEGTLGTTIGLKAPYHQIARDYYTPLNWMPFEPSETLANLFHCTVSRALKDIYVERAILPASELRLRGIPQETGESANEQLPRQSISMTRNLPEAFCYHRHSPPQMLDFPVVFGISRDVIAKSRKASYTEPGEILTDRLRLGNSLLHNFGIGKTDITHIYAPESQVSTIEQGLAAHRIKGVRVVALNQIQEPQWIPVQFEDGVPVFQ